MPEQELASSKSPVHPPEETATPPADQGGVEAQDRSDPADWVDLYGDYLFNYAIGRLRDAAKAQDLVQEVFLAALKGRQRFAGRSAERTWLTGIMRHKIYDHYRKASRERSFTDLEFYSDEESERFIPDGLHEGGWNRDLGPLEWSTDPGSTLDSAAFWQAFRECAGKLPEKTATVFTLREVDQVSGREICEMLNISESNLWVMLHRARMALRGCLETHWFGKESSAK
jgi:RNA polymerase sigma-70 factor (ECF subfamily)